MDKRHGEHPSKWPFCRRGRQCVKPHDHESELVDPEGHLVNDFYWTPGSSPLTPEQYLICDCGRRLVHADLDDLYDPKHMKE
jgi:hypothetical protein